MEPIGERNELIDNWEKVMFLYGSALKKIRVSMEILQEEFMYTHNYNPIEHMKFRLKKPESIVKKLRKYGYDSTIENMVEHIKDMAGVRIICSFTPDIYKIADMISSHSDIKVQEIKDYISNPKESGYTSYHMIVSIPVRLNNQDIETYVEVQIRTVAMDFWASLEHKIQYKFNGEGQTPEYIRKDLKECAKIVAELDARMLALNESIQKIENE